MRNIYSFVDKNWKVILLQNNLESFLRKNDFPASELDWDRIEHFTVYEHWGKLDKVSAILVMILDRFRDYCGIPFYLTPAGEGASYSTHGHAPYSWHYVIHDRYPFALAVDFFPEPRNESTYLDIAHIALMKKWRGIGVYPDTHHSGLGEGAHLVHLDLRFTPSAYWVRIKGKYVSYHTEEEFVEALDQLEKDQERENRDEGSSQGSAISS